LNRAAGSWFHASDDLLTLVLLAQSYVEQTLGLFDPSILPDLERIGYDRSMDLIRAQGVFSLPDLAPRQHVAFDGVIIRPDEALICLPQGMALDLGGIAKGWIAEQAAHVMAAYTPVCGVNAGGDMYLRGIPDGLDGWPVALDDPRSPGENLLMLDIPPGAVATSSITKRTWKQAGLSRHHLIDPRTGEPAQSEWLSVTVIAPHADQCEVFAKALLIAGPQQAQEIASHAGIAFLAVDREGQLVGNHKSLEYLYDRKN
jgi:thiamine biosynthesis lipoprotein